MQQDFASFLAACNEQRHLLIAVECLQQHLQEYKLGGCTGSTTLREELLEQIVALSASLATNVESLILVLPAGPDRWRASQEPQEIEDACHHLLETNLFVVQTALAVINQYGLAPWTIHALTDTALRTRSIHARLPG